MPSLFSLAPVEHEWPRVTIIVPTKPGQAEIPSVEAARQLDYPRERIDVIVARGKQPAIQRNRALREATGEIIYFLDDDARPGPSSLRRAVEHFQNDPKVQMVGGPNLCPSNAPFLEQVFAVVLASWIAFGPSRARYDRVGAVRSSGEKELILCNLLARRATMLEVGGFDEALYPNEENALMDEVQKRGGILLYDPEVVAERRPRSTLKAFCKMLMTYGRGRAEQFRLHPTPGSAMNFVPPLFVLYLFTLLPLVWFFSKQGNELMLFLVNAPGMIYWPVLLLQTLVSMPRFGIIRSLAAFPLLFATHFFYGVGFWRGLFTRVDRTKPAATEVTFDRPVL
jgi:succinoglycan biosynthesis protein ExoA